MAECMAGWLGELVASWLIKKFFYGKEVFVTPFIFIIICHNYCSTPSKEKLSCLGEHYFHKILYYIYYFYYYYIY